MSETDTIPKATSLLKEIIETILGVNLPRNRWSCSDDASGTSLTLRRQQRFIADAVRGVMERHDSKTETKPQIPAQPTVYGHATWKQVSSEIAVGTPVELLGLELNSLKLEDSIYWIRYRIIGESYFRHKICRANQLDFEKEG